MERDQIPIQSQGPFKGHHPRKHHIIVLEATGETDHVGQIPLDLKTRTLELRDRQKLAQGHMESMAETPEPSEPRVTITPSWMHNPMGYSGVYVGGGAMSRYLWRR